MSMIESAEQEATDNSESENTLTQCQSLAYGVGHFNNDLTTSFAFSYYILFTLDVLEFKPWMTGVMMMTSQLSDALSTVIVSLKSDKKAISSCLNWIGKRKSWHLIGTVGVGLLSPPVFSQCYGCFGSNSEALTVLYFALLIAVCQIFWSFTQVSHLAMIPELASTDSQRTTLTSLRCGTTLISYIISFCFFIIFISGSGWSSSNLEFSPHDLGHFRSCAWTLSAVGCFVTLFFYFGVREPQLQINNNNSHSNQSASSTESESKMKPKDWLKEKQFYQLYVAVFPMIVYLVGFLTSILISLPSINRHLSRKVTFLIGITTSTAACCCLFFDNLGKWMYPICILVGMSQSILLLTALGTVADLVNKDTETSAFVYGSINFADKFTNAIMLQIIQLCLPSSPTHHQESVFYRDVMVFVRGACLIGAFIVSLTLIKQTIGNRSTRQRRNYERLT